ncbi:MAG: ArsI/CadI family heavy metal resistance metalloenzyme [Woeseiaceae bacterium]|nr:ArsI/CadI family heavy metal resistance metalloenzyme [Woeseiaceae bacterium]
MKRIHINVGVADIGRSVEFYRTLFGVEPAVHKDDYAKWMLDDPRVNFSINLTESHRGLDHVGVQAETEEELAEIQTRLAAAEAATYEQPTAECCYASSTKTWVRDPDDVTWETFVTHGQIESYGADRHVPGTEETATSCCR